MIGCVSLSLCDSSRLGGEVSLYLLMFLSSIYMWDGPGPTHVEFACSPCLCGSPPSALLSNLILFWLFFPHNVAPIVLD